MVENTASPDEKGIDLCAPAKTGLLLFGWLNVGLGVIGIILPVMPTTVFLLIALWAFSKSSSRFHRWLYDHPTLGLTLRAWHDHGVIPLRAKIMALGMMSTSLIYVSLYVAEGWALPLGLAMVLSAVSCFIVTRPSRVPVPRQHRK